jgi:hypothetical protein
MTSENPEELFGINNVDIHRFVSAMASRGAFNPVSKGEHTP